MAFSLDFNDAPVNDMGRPADDRPALSLADVMARAAEELAKAGLETDELLADGQLHRCRSIHSGNSRNTAGEYRLYADKWPVILLCNYSAGGERLHPVKLFDERGLSLAEKAKARAEMEKRARLAEEERRKQQEEAAKKVAAILRQATPLDHVEGGHGYLEKKKVQACARLSVDAAGNLLVPMYDAAFNIRSMQSITPEGVKRFYPGGQVSGTFFAIDPSEGCEDGTVYVVEGLATGLSVHEATGGATVAVAFTAGNLMAACRAIMQGWPDFHLALVADNDWKKAKEPGGTNTGVDKATAVAKQLGIPLVVPKLEGREFPDGRAATDANDLAALDGLDAVAAAITAQIGALPRVRQVDAASAAAAESYRPPRPTGYDVLADFEEYRSGAGKYEGVAPNYNWLLVGSLEQGALAVLAGAGGTGKSTAAQQLCYAVGTGTAWLGTWQVAGGPGTAVYMSAEDSLATMHRRDEHIRRFLKPEEQELATRNVFAFPIEGNATLVSQEPRGEAVKWDNEAWLKVCTAMQSIKPRLLVLDPLSSISIVNEVSNVLWTQVMEGLYELVREYNCTILVVHHVAKTGFGAVIDKETEAKALSQDVVRGAGAIVNRARAAIVMAALSADYANSILDGEPVEHDGEIVAMSFAKKNVGAREAVRCFQHDPLHAGLLVPRTRLTADGSERERQKMADKNSELDGLAERLAMEAVRRALDPAGKPIPKSTCGVTVRASKFLSAAIYTRAQDNDLVTCEKGQGKGGGLVVKPTDFAMKLFGPRLARKEGAGEGQDGGRIEVPAEGAACQCATGQAGTEEARPPKATVSPRKRNLNRQGRKTNPPAKKRIRPSMQ